MTPNNQKSHDIAAMMRVNHAGEYGAVCLYAGQLFVKYDPLIASMKVAEQQHLREFTHLLIKNQVRPSWLQPVWHVGGFMMGAISALTGRAHVCTAAVESVIDEHYTDQLRQLRADQGEDVQALQDIVAKCHAEELHHKADAEHALGVDPTVAYPVTTAVIKGITRLAIRIAKVI